MLHGRVNEQARAARLLDAARSGHGESLVVVGEPGSGKSALLASVVAAASADLRVLETRGLESESPLAFAALQRLLTPLIPLAGHLPAPQAKALRVAFGELEGDSSSDRFLAFLATLNLLAEAAESQPVLVVVDDAHWLDDASAAGLLFVARRLEVERVAMLFAARDEDVRTFDSGDLPRLSLAGLDLAAGADLLREATGSEVGPEVVRRLMASTEGNPLALVEMPHALSSDQLADRSPIPGTLPVTATIERVFLDRARRLSPGAQQWLLVAAADDSMRLAAVDAAALRTGADAAASREAEASGLVRVRDGGVDLRHPLVRSALYAAASSADRRRVHSALADALRHPEDADRRAWHRAASVDEPDAGVVADLEAAAVRAERRGGHEAAAAAWERAAELTGDRAGRGHRLFEASRCSWLAGRPALARALVENARSVAEEPLLVADLVRLRARIEWNTGSVQSAHRMLLEGARDVAPRDASRARSLAMVAAALAAFGGDSGVDVDPATFAVAGPTASAQQRCYAELILVLREVAVADWASATVLLRQAFTTAEEVELDDLELLPNLAIAALHVGDTVAADAFHQRMLSTARDAGAVATILHALTRLAFSDVPHGRWALAAARQHEALRLGEGTGQPVLAGMPLATLLLVSALRGDDAYDAELVSVERTLEDQPAGVLDTILRDVTRWAKGLRATPAWPSALHQLSQISHPIIRRSAGIDRVEAAVHAGRPETALVWIEDLEGFATATGQRWAAAMATHGRAVLAVSREAADAGSWFEQALAHHADSGRPFERARTQLAYGEHLRRHRRRVDARVHLRAAYETFEELKAQRWAARSAQELRASGETTRTRDRREAIELTPTELQVAQLVQQGLSNRDVAAQLFVSPRTIDFHLRNVFAKTGVTSRGALSQLSLT